MGIRSYAVAGSTTWLQASEEGLFQLGCCDCGLVHRLEFRVTDEGRVEFRAVRLERSTGQLRRHMRRRGEGIL